MQKHRPLGVTIIAILTIIEGILLLLGGASLIAVGALISVAPHTTTAEILLIPQFFGVIPAAIAVTVRNRYSLPCYVLRVTKRKRMGMDDNNNTSCYRNCNSNNVNDFWRCV